MENIINRPNLFTVTVDNGDGTYTDTMGIVPVNYVDESGSIKKCELDIIEEKNWEFEYVVKKNNFTAYFNDATDIDNYTLASFEIKNSQGASRWINYKLWDATPTNSVIKKNTIKYTEVFPEVDLEYVVDTYRLKENIIVKSPIDNFSYTFTLKMDPEVKLEKQEDGSIYFIDVDTSEILWRIDAPYAKDKGDKENKIAQQRTENVSYTLGKAIYNDVEYDSITVTLNDQEFIENAIYPITIDPTTAWFYPDFGNANDYYRQTWCPSTTVPELGNWGTYGSSAVLHFSGLNTYKSYAVSQVIIGVNSNYDESWGSVNATIRCRFFISDWTGARPYNNLPASTSFVESGYAYQWNGWGVDVTSLWNSYKASYNFYGINVYPGSWPVTDSYTYCVVDSYTVGITYTPPGYGHGVMGISNPSSVIGIAAPSGVMGIV